MTKCNVVLAMVMASLVSMSAMAGERKALQGVINPNTATATELMLLPGVGAAKAELILQARAQKPFATKEDLLAVKGVGEKMLAQWEPYLAFAGTTSLKEVAAAPKAEVAATAVIK